MATVPSVREEEKTGKSQIVEMNWDPITRIVGSLGIFTKIDFGRRKVVECHSTSSIFRGYSIFMKGKDPRAAHFITSRICGICGDNHATCATYAQNMAFGIKPPPIAEWIVNLGEAAEYMFDHNIYQDNLVGVDFCETMVKETNPGVWEKAEKTAAPHAELQCARHVQFGNGKRPVERRHNNTRLRPVQIAQCLAPSLGLAEQVGQTRLLP
jgi:hydrogenase large subunit